jgi:sugar phosphate permease
MMFFAVLYFQYLTSIFKLFGEQKGLSDSFLTYAASLSVIFNCVSRLVGGIILDHVSFKSFFGWILALSTFLALTYEFVAQYESLFILYLSATYFVNGAIFVSAPIFFAKVYGSETGS